MAELSFTPLPDDAPPAAPKPSSSSAVTFTPIDTPHQPGILARVGGAMAHGNVLGLTGPTALERSAQMEVPYVPGTTKKLGELVPKDWQSNPMLYAFAPGNLAGPAKAALGVMTKAGDTLRRPYYRGIRPPAAMTASERGAYDASVRTAVDHIVDMRGGKNLPRSPEDFSTAIGEVKPETYRQYSGMAQSAEQQGAKVRLQPAVDRLRKLAGDPLQDPAATAEAQRLLKLVPPGQNPTIAPTRADEIVRFLNERATGLETAGTKGGVFREAASALRDELINTVEGAGFPEFGKLRRAYGALSEIEQHVGSAAGRDLSRGSPFGLSETLASGFAAAGEPVTAGAIEATKLGSRWWSAPSRQISKLFEEAAAQRGKLSSAPAARRAAKAQAGQAIAAAPGLAARGIAEEDAQRRKGAVPAPLIGLRDRIEQQRQGAAGGEANQ